MSEITSEVSLVETLEIETDVIGVRGSRGYSAYEVAVRNGYTGTEEEWLASLKGERGERGETGSQGVPGNDGQDGTDGHSPVITTNKSGKTTTILSDGTAIGTVLDGNDGQNGQDGRDGVNGQDGISPTVTITEITGGHRVTITDATGTHTADVMDGQEGSPGAKGDPGEGIPTGGTAGQVLKKSSATDYDAEWANESGSVTDVQVNGSSIVNDGVANVPVATLPSGASSSSLGVVKVRNGYDGLKLSADDPGRLMLSPPTSTQIKAGNDAYIPVTASKQHESTFYGLAKAAGDTTQSASSNAVGTYTDAAKIAIQKMLGIYEAPWELIRNDTGTNATEADIEITVDGNGNAYELTDIRMLFWLPTQETTAGKGDYGRIRFYYDNSNNDAVYCGNFTQTNRVIGAEIEQKCNMIKLTMWKNAVISAETYQQNTVRDYPYTPNNSQIWSLLSGQRVYNKIVITNVTGTYGYVIYGKRKWS